MNHSSLTTRYLNFAQRAPQRDRTLRLPSVGLLLLLSLLLFACGETTTDPTPNEPEPVIPPSEAVGSLQITVQGLPGGVAASILVAAEDYNATVSGSRTLQNLRTGSYTLEVESIEYRDATYSGAFSGSNQTEVTVDVTENDTTIVEVTYTSVGSVEEGEIAPGTAREGLVAENAFDDYTFNGAANVPLTFDFTGTGEENQGNYRILIFDTDDLEEPLYSSSVLGTFGRAPLIGFSPPEDGGYVLRIRGENNVVDYRVRAQYLSGPPEERQTPTVIDYGDTATGAVTTDSYDEYRFTGSFNEPILLSFSYDNEDNRYNGTYRVELDPVGQEEPIETSPLYGSYGAPPEIDFAPQGDGDYLIRVVGAGTQGTSLVRYSFELERLE